jgi:hypothetical protein
MLDNMKGMIAEILLYKYYFDGTILVPYLFIQRKNASEFSTKA